MVEGALGEKFGFHFDGAGQLFVLGVGFKMTVRKEVNALGFALIQEFQSFFARNAVGIHFWRRAHRFPVSSVSRLLALTMASAVAAASRPLLPPLMPQRASA